MSASMMRTRTSSAAGRTAALSSGVRSVPRVAFRAGCAHTGPCACSRKALRCAAAVATEPATAAAPAANERDLGHR